MPRPSGHWRYTLTVLCTSVVYLAFAYLILRPMEWRTPLLRLFVRAFGSFTAMQSSNGVGWTLSVIVSSLSTILLTLVLVGTFQGFVALKQHWVQNGAIALLALIGQLVFLWGPIYLRTLVRTVYEDHQSATARLDDLTAKLAAESKRCSECAQLKSKGSAAMSSPCLHPVHAESINVSPEASTGASYESVITLVDMNGMPAGSRFQLYFGKNFVTISHVWASNGKGDMPASISSTGGTATITIPNQIEKGAALGIRVYSSILPVRLVCADRLK